MSCWNGRMIVSLMMGLTWHDWHIASMIRQEGWMEKLFDQ